MLKYSLFMKTRQKGWYFKTITKYLLIGILICFPVAWYAGYRMAVVHERNDRIDMEKSVAQFKGHNQELREENGRLVGVLTAAGLIKTVGAYPVAKEGKRK